MFLNPIQVSTSLLCGSAALTRPTPPLLRRPFGFEGWRFVFLVVAAFSLLVGCGVLFGVEDPGKKGTDDEEGGEERWGEDRMQLLGGGARNSASIFHKDVERAEGATMWQATRRVLRVPTFQVIVAQGVVGTM